MTSFLKKAFGKGFQSGTEETVTPSQRGSFVQGKGSQKSLLENFDAKNFNPEAVKEEKKEEKKEYSQDGRLIITNLSTETLIDDMKIWIDLKDRTTIRGDVFPMAFTGSEGNDGMFAKWDLKERSEALDLGARFIEEEFIEMCTTGTMRNVWKDGANYFYAFVDRKEKKNISGMSSKELFKDLLSMIELKEKIQRDDEIYYKCFQGNEAVRLMLENWEIEGKEEAIAIGKKFIEEEMIQIASSELANAFKDTKVWYSVIQIPENREEQMKELLERFAVEYNPKTIDNPEYPPNVDYESIATMQSKPAWFELIDDLTKAIQEEFIKHNYKRQWERDAKLWRSTLKYPGTSMKRDIMRRIFCVLRFAPFFLIREGGASQYWYETGWPISVAVSHGSRVMIQTPPCYDPLSKIQVDEFWNWLLTGDRHGDPAKAISLDLSGEDSEKQHKALFKRLAATHGISTGVREGMKGGFIKYIKEERTSGISNVRVLGNDPAQVHTHSHWGMNVPLGGYGLQTILGEKITGNGEHGHMYIYHLPGEENKCGGILFGLEGSEFNKFDQTGHKHNINATSSMLSPTFGFKWTHGKKQHKIPSDLSTIGGPRRIDGMFVDLSFGFDYIMEMYNKWNDDWVMETSLKPPPNLKSGSGYLSRELEGDEKLEMIRISDATSRDKIDMYRQFVRETENKKEILHRQLMREERFIAIAQNRIEQIQLAVKEHWTQEDLLQKIKELQDEVNTLKRGLSLPPSTPLTLVSSTSETDFIQATTELEKTEKVKKQLQTSQSVPSVEEKSLQLENVPMVDEVNTPLQTPLESKDRIQQESVVVEDPVEISTQDIPPATSDDDDQEVPKEPEVAAPVQEVKVQTPIPVPVQTEAPKSIEEKVSTPKIEMEIEEKKPVRTYYGNVLKQGEGFKTWNTRYFVLFSDGEMEYYKDAQFVKGSDYADLRKASLKGSFNIKNCRFRSAKGIRKGDLVLELELSDRMFLMAIETSDEFAGWKRAIQTAGAEFYEQTFPPKGKQRTKSIVKRKTDKDGSKGRAATEQLENGI